MSEKPIHELYLAGTIALFGKVRVDRGSQNMHDIF